MWLSKVSNLAALAVAVGCGTAGVGSGAGDPDAGASGGAGSSGGNGATGGTTQITGGAAGLGGFAGMPETGGAAGFGGVAGSAVGGTGGKPPMCASSSECKEASTSYPGNTEPGSPSPTDCVDGQCGLVTSYNGSYQTPKTPTSCTEICAASTYEGKPLVCSPSCNTQVVNGFGDEGLFFGGPDAGPGTIGGQVMYQFSTIAGAYKFLEVSCSQVPQSKLIQGSNSYTYVSHRCCCVAP